MSETPDKETEFVQELTKHQMALGFFLRALLPAHADSDSLLQEVNLTLWNKRDDFQTGSNFKAWAFQTAKFHALNERRKLKRDRILPFDDQVLEILAKESIFEDDTMVDKRKALDLCLQKISPANRELIKYRYSRNLSIEQYSQKHGKNPGTLRNTMRRLRFQLKECINQQLQSSEL